MFTFYINIWKHWQTPNIVGMFFISLNLNIDLKSFQVHPDPLIQKQFTLENHERFLPDYRNQTPLLCFSRDPFI